ncbi:MAG: SDR family oxidoreductase [Actinomycetota bacterium]|nr:SDR family oxidoreductase [Actinomycetota bacterium]
MTTRPVAVVTGASRGLGFLLARELADQGHDLVICARSADGLDKAAAELRGRGGQVVTVAADVSVQAQAEAVVAAATEHFGRLDVLVANAGVIQVGPAAAMRTSDFADALGVMFWGVLYPTMAALPLMRARGSGRVLVITSLGGKVPAPHLLPYTVAKHAAVGFAEGLRVEAARHGITVTTAVPGLMRTGSPRNALFTGDRAAEYRWFSVADSLPLLSMDAERAAAKLIRATLRGSPEIVLTPAGKLAVRLHGLAPATTIRLLSLANRLLPTDEARTPLAPGHAVGKDGPVVSALTGLTRSAARRFHQHDDAVQGEESR